MKPIQDRYEELINQYAFEIHEFANGAKWDHTWWMNKIFSVLLQEYKPIYDTNTLGYQLDNAGQITTILGDDFQVKKTNKAYLIKLINGKDIIQWI